jgi:amidophosphoribosyltransferase
MPRIEKIAVKDVKLRTFITDDTSRNDLVHHVYDVTYGIVNNDVDTLVVLDDSIVRGTTLKESILTMLDRLQPKKIIVVSSAPQIRYPDCYGIDMSKMGSFVAFQAAIALWKDSDKYHVLQDLYKRCKEEVQKPIVEMQNLVKEVYAPFTAEEISAKISDIVKPQSYFCTMLMSFIKQSKIYIKLVQIIQATGILLVIIQHQVVTKFRLNAFINYMEGKNVRAY